jgi:hypothetical protein
MSAVAVVVTKIFREESLQVAFIKRDHMVEKIAPAASDPTLCHSVLPWALK